MSKRTIEENISSSSKKIKIDQVDCLPEDIWTHTIFPYLDGNELFKTIRLVSSLWNNLVLSTRCDIQVYFPTFTIKEVDSIVVPLKSWEYSDRITYQPTSFLYLNDEEHCKQVREFIQSGEEGKFKNVTGITFKSKIHPCFFEKIFNLDWKHLKTLNLMSNTLDAEGAKFLANGNMKNLTQLNLSNNSIGNEGVGYLSKSFKELTVLNVLCNNIDHEGAQYLQGDYVKNLTQLNTQSLSNGGGNRFHAMTAHFCGETPFTIHPFDNTDDLKDYLFNYYIKYWNRYAKEELGLSKDDVDREVLKEKIYPLPFGRIAGLAVGEVGGMVFNECEREAVIGIVYGQEITEESLAKSDESTPFVVVEKLDGYSHECNYFIGKSKLEERLAKEDYDEEDLEEFEGNAKTFKQISSLLQSGIDNDDGRDIFLAFFIGEIVDGAFVEFKKNN